MGDDYDLLSDDKTIRRLEIVVLIMELLGLSLAMVGILA